MAEILDAWSNCIAAPDATTITGEYGYWVFTGPSFTGTVPEGMEVIKSPTDHVWMLLRTLCMGEDDLPNVIAIQNEMRTYMLSDFLNGEVEYAGKGTYDPANNFTIFDSIPDLRGLAVERVFYTLVSANLDPFLVLSIQRKENSKMKPY